MFWRLFATYLLMVVAAVGLVGLVVVQRVGGTDLVLRLAWDVIPVSVAICVLSAVPAYYFAFRFTRPLYDLTAGTRRLTDGDFGHTVQVTGSSEVAALAETFNGLSRRLADTFSQIGRDREQLRTILSGMVEGVVAVDNGQRVLFANDRAVQLLGFPSDQVVGRVLAEITRREAVHVLVAKTLAGAGPFREELDWPGPADTSLAVYVSRLPGPESPGAVLVLHDITDIRRLERLRQDFVANVSHELKTPLANIKSSVGVLLDGAVEQPASRGGFLAEIDDQTDRLDALIQDLLVLARIESGQTGLECEPIEVEEAVHDCLDRHRTRAEAKRLRLSGVALAGCPSDLAVFADNEGMAQLLDNLVDNAVKYTPDGGRVTVRWDADAELVCVEVADTGLGIPAHDLPRVFERFYRVDKARSREMGGTGLGLAIVKHLAQAMHGTVKVTSTVGQGTTFRVCLPRVPE